MSDNSVELLNSAGHVSKYKLAVMQELLVRMEKLDEDLSQYEDVQHLLNDFREFTYAVQTYKESLVAHIKNLETENVTEA